MRAAAARRRLRRLGERLAVSATARAVKDQRLTYLSWRSLRHLERAATAARSADGSFVECGMALGGSAVVIRSLLPPGREFHGYDVFTTIPPPASDKDDEKSRERYAVIASGASTGIGGDPYYGYVPDLVARVRRTLRDFGLEERTHLHEGLFEETLWPNGPIAFAHLDCDWYDPVRLCLERIQPVWSRGGYLICDDYNNYGGAREAVDEFLGAHRDVRAAAEIMGRTAPERTTSLVLARS
jgi:asparagine synthase (glutamine-hydrolysing)